MIIVSNFVEEKNVSVMLPAVSDLTLTAVQTSVSESKIKRFRRRYISLTL